MVTEWQPYIVHYCTMYMYDDYYGYDVHVLWMNIIAQVMDGFVVPPDGQN